MNERKMTTEEYVRDPRFATIVLGCDDGEGKNGWVAADKISDLLNRFDWDRTAVLAHHAAFDGLVAFEARLRWYAPIDKAETYQQANARIHRPGQSYPTTVVQLASRVL
jgi:hypothetical protein